MSIPTLITGFDAAAREKKALDMASALSSKYDTVILNTKENRGIEQIRYVSERLNKAPLNSAYTTLIVVEAQNLTLEAQNALLKSLEEPPKRGKIMLTAPTREAVLSTISSRCEEITVRQTAENQTGYRKMGKLLSSSFYDRFEQVGKLDNHLWTSFWRADLLKKAQASPERLDIQATKRVLNYLKLALKLNKLKKKNVSTKLLNTILLLQAPVSSTEK